MPGFVPAPVLNLQPAPGPGALSRVVASSTGVGASGAQPAYNWFVRIGGSNDNGGSSSSLTAERTGTDGAYVAGGALLNSATGNFVATDVGKGICVNTGANARRYRIVAVNSGTQIQLDRVHGLSTSGLTWAIGGAWADARPAAGDIAVTATSASPVSAGDTVWFGSGQYRARVSMSITVKAATIYFIGDTSGAMTGDPGRVEFTAWLTSDTAAPTGSTFWTAGANVSFLTFRNINFVGIGGAILFQGSGTDFRFESCSFTVADQSAASSGMIVTFITTGVAVNWSFVRCRFGQSSVAIMSPTINKTSADYSMNFLFESCIFQANAFQPNSGGSGSGLPGGVIFRNCTFLASTPFTTINAGTFSRTYPLRLTNCLVLNSTQTLGGGTLGQVIEDWNIHILNNNTFTNITQGSNTSLITSPRLSMGEDWGQSVRPFLEPLAGSPAIGFGSDTYQAPLDALGRPRPPAAASKQATIGALERGNAFTKETGTVHTGSNAVSKTGFGSHDFQMPVTAGSTYQPSFFCNVDSSYVGPPPLLQLLNGEEAGVSPQTRCNPAQSAGDGWLQIQLNAFTAISNGIVTIRIVSQDQSGASKVVFDTFSDGKQ